MKRGFLFVLAAVMLGASGPQADTDAGSQDIPSVTTVPGSTGSKESPYELGDTIVVTANRFGMAPAKLLWPAEAITTRRLEAHATLESLLDGTAGVDIRQSSGEGSISTLSNWGLFNRHMLLLYDGRAVKDYSLGGFNLAGYSSEEFARVEIVKGPQSAFYGADAVGGVINLIPRNSLQNRLTFTGRLGSNDVRQYRVDASRTRSGAGVGVFAEFSMADNHRDNAGTERMLFGFRTDLLSRDDRHDFSLSGRYFKDSLGVPGPVPDAAFIPVYGNDNSSSLFDHQKDEDYSLDARYRFYDDNFGQVHIDLFWEKKNLDYNSLYNYPAFYYTPDGPADSALNIDSVDVHSRSVVNKRSGGISGRYSRRLRNWSVATGIDWLTGSVRATQNDITDGTNILGPVSPYSYQSEAYSFWFKSQDQFDLWSAVTTDPREELRIDVSGRLQFVKNRTVQPSYNLGFVVAPIEDIVFKIAYGYAFRTPTIAEQFAEGFYTRGNADLNPETSRSFIASVSVYPKGSDLNAAVTLFRQSVDSLIQYRFELTTFHSVPINVEEFRTTGFDFALGYDLNDRMKLRGSLVYQKAEQTTDDGKTFVDAYYVPDLKWRVEAEGDLSSRATYVITLTHTADRSITMYGGTSKIIDKVYELGASVALSVTSRVRLIMSGMDLTDQRRPDQFGFTPSDGDYPSPGRRLNLKVIAELL